MKLVLFLAVVAAALTATGQAGARHYVPHKPFEKMTAQQKKTWLVRQDAHAQGAVSWLESHLAVASRPRSVASVTSSLAVLRSHVPGWRVELRWYRSSHRVVSRELDEIRAGETARAAASGDWSTFAVPYADRVFPGTAGWLTSCSASEGGHGGWIPNSEGSGAGGWMQFMSGTFYGNVDAAFGEARRRGFAVPAAARSWLSPLGQAVTAAYMVQHGGSGPWTGSGC